MTDSGDFLTTLLDQTGRLLDQFVDRDLLVAAEAGASLDVFAAEVESFGFSDALTVAPDEGGLSFSAAAALFHLFGFHAAPLPLGETMLARGLLARSGLPAPQGFLGLLDLKDGRQSVACGAAMTHVIGQEAGQLRLFRLTPGDLRPVASIARSRRIEVDLSTAEIVGEGAWPGGMPSAITLGAMLRASQIAGAVARVLALSVEYASIRKQFGRPIGGFQAVQQLLAKLASEAAAAQSVSDSAWAALDVGDLGYAAAVAKIRTGEAARAAAAIGHQVHGAIGVTDEHILHFFTRRLWEWRLDFGSENTWAEWLGRAVREAPNGVWTLLTGGSPRSFEAGITQG